MSYASAPDFPGRRGTSAVGIRGAEVSREGTSAQDVAGVEDKTVAARKAPGPKPWLQPCSEVSATAVAPRGLGVKSGF